MENIQTMEKLLDTGEAASALGMSAAWLIKTRWAGGGPKFLKLGKSVRYRLTDLAEYVDGAGRNSTSDAGKRGGAQHA